MFGEPAFDAMKHLLMNSDPYCYPEVFKLLRLHKYFAVDRLRYALETSKPELRLAYQFVDRGIWGE